MHYYIRETINRPYEKTIIEKKAPTDDSIKLYEEIKEKAYESILDTLEVHNNLLNATGIIYKEATSYNTICKYIVVLNGKEIKGKLVLKEFEYDKSQIFEDIIENISKYIAIELLKNLEGRKILWT